MPLGAVVVMGVGEGAGAGVCVSVEGSGGVAGKETTGGSKSLDT